MTLPVYRPPDLPYEATSRYRESRRFTPPTPTIIAAFLTIVAKFQKKYDVAIAAFCLMGSHDHIIPINRDPDKPCQVGRFKQQVHSCMGKFLQSYWNLPDDPVYCQRVAGQIFAILDYKRLVEKIAYVESNFISAGLVASNEELPPGAVSTRRMMDVPLVVERPDVWFRPNRWPATAEIKVEIPAWYLEQEQVSEDRFRYQAQFEGFRTAHLANKERVESGRTTAGLESLQAQTPIEPQKKEVNLRRTLFTGNDKAKNAHFYLRYRRFLRAYRRAMERVASGRYDTRFPFGTCKMTLSYGFEMYVPPG